MKINQIEFEGITYELKKAHYSPELSEETPAFSCEVYIGKSKVAHVKNAGCGGGNSVYAESSTHRENLYKLENEIMDAAVLTYSVESLQGSNFVLRKEDRIFTSPTAKSVKQLKNDPAWNKFVKYMSDQFTKDGYVILNTNLQ